MGEMKPPPTRIRKKMLRVTMSDVAEAARVSPSTVSLFMRDPARVSPAAGQSIDAAIGALGYVRSAIAGGLAGAGSKVVSVIVPSVRNAFFAETVLSLQAELAGEGLQVMLGNSRYSAKSELELLKAALSWNPAAIVLTGLDHLPETRKLLGRVSFPVIETWELGGAPIDTAIGFSHHDVGVMAARHLTNKGRRNLVFLGARLHEDRRAMQRAQGFVATAEAEGARARVFNHPAPAGAEVGTILLAQALEAPPSVDGIACSNDSVAVGVLFECIRRGVPVPSALSVIGFGDLEASGFCNPPLTTIKPSGDVIGREAARQIIQRLRDGGPALERNVDTGFSLVERSST